MEYALTGEVTENRTDWEALNNKVADSLDALFHSTYWKRSQAASEGARKRKEARLAAGSTSAAGALAAAKDADRMAVLKDAAKAEGSEPATS